MKAINLLAIFSGECDVQVFDNIAGGFRSGVGLGEPEVRGFVCAEAVDPRERKDLFISTVP
jgi:hypothetical protein